MRCELNPKENEVNETRSESLGSFGEGRGNESVRKYVQLDDSTRRMKPSELGLALCHAYMLIDPELLGSHIFFVEVLLKSIS